jgi:hypothetical protein
LGSGTCHEGLSPRIFPKYSVMHPCLLAQSQCKIILQIFYDSTLVKLNGTAAQRYRHSTANVQRFLNI